jgi:hypothetical protein
MKTRRMHRNIAGGTTLIASLFAIVLILAGLFLWGPLVKEAGLVPALAGPEAERQQLSKGQVSTLEGFLGVEHGGPARQGAIDSGSRPVDTSPVASASPGDDALVVAVSSESGLPLPGAAVETWRSAYGTAEAVVLTDERGECRVHVVEGWELSVSAESHVEERRPLTRIPRTGRIDIVLRRGQTLLQARVIDDLEQPVSEARVSLTFGDETWQSVSDENGYVSLACRELPEEKNITVTTQVEHPDYCWLLSGLPVPFSVDPDRQRTFQVHRWAQVTYDVRDPEGRPLADAFVRVAYSAQLELGEERFRVPGAPHLRVIDKDATGRAVETLEHVPPLVPTALVVEHDRFEPLEVELGTLEPAEERRLTCTFQSGTERLLFKLRVRGPDDAIVAKGTAYWESGETQGGHRLDEQGEGEFTPPDGPWTLRIVAPGYASHRHEFGTRAPGELDVVLEPSDAAIRVRVLHEDGTPAERVWIRALEEVPAGVSWQVEKGGSTGSDGWVTLRGLDDKVDYRVMQGHGSPGMFWPDEQNPWVVSPAVYRRAEVGDELELRLVSPGAIGGRVNARRVTGKNLSISLIHPDYLGERPDFTTSCSLSADGDFLFTGLPPGHYRIWGRTFGAHDWNSPLETIDLLPGEERRGLEVRAR